MPLSRHGRSISNDSRPGSHRKMMKTAGSALERRLTVHKLAFREHQIAYSKSLKEARSKFYSNLINKNTGNSKKLFPIVNHLLKPQPSLSTEATDERCNNFIDFFRSKVNNIRSLMPSSFLLPLPPTLHGEFVISPMCH